MAKKKKVIIWVVIAAVVLGGIFFYFKTKKIEVERTTEAVKIGDVARTVSVTGEIIPEKYYRHQRSKSTNHSFGARK